MTPKISVIVPVYNAGQWLRRCVDSILGQTFTDFELLLIDDGSTDDSAAICDEYAALDPRVRVFHKPNGGVSSARNLGLDHARGAWLTFADADDWQLPAWSEVAGATGSLEADMLVSGFTLQSPDGAVVTYAYEFEGSPHQWMELEAADKMRGSLCCKFFRAELIERHYLRLDTRFAFREDEEFALRYLTHARSIKAIPLATYYYLEPDWGTKYDQMYRDLNIFWMVCQFQTIYKLIGLRNSTARENMRELLARTKYNSFHDPLRTPVYVYHFLRQYFRWLSV